LGIGEISSRYPKTAGFLAVMPSISLMVFIFSRIEYGSDFDTAKFLRGVLVGIPGILVFWSPYFFMKNFWAALITAFVLSAVLFVVYRYFSLV
jgi:hypothetical protein